MEKARGLKKSNRDKDFFKTCFPVVALIVIVLLFAIITNGRSLRMRNIRQIMLQSCIYIVAGLGVIFTVAQGCMDMSLGGIICMAGALGIIGSETNPWIMFPVILMVCVSSELFIGGVHILLNIPSVIVSFAVSFFGRGIAGFLIANRTRGLKLPGMFDILYNRLLFFAITIISIVIITMVFHYTKAGKYVMSIGSNLNAARAAGINITKYKILGFGITGLMMALATTMTVARAGGAGATSGAGFEIDILLMIVIGGVSLNGGTKTKVFSVIVGAFVLLCLENGLTIVGFSPNVIGVVKGVIFLCAVGMTFDRDGVPYII